MSTPEAFGARSGAVPRPSGPTASPWLRILRHCTVAVSAMIAAAGTAAGLLNGLAGAVSAVLGYAVVVVFFGISLVIGHVAGQKNPSGAIGLFIVTYVVKVVGFAAVLFAVGAPGWLNRNWFFAGAVATVIVWQIVELHVFSKARFQLYSESVTIRKIEGDDRSHA